MADLTGQTPAATYKDLIQVSNSNAGVDATLREISSGAGTNSILKISTTQIQLGSTTAVDSVLDEDTLSSDSAVALATQQSIKAYVDAAGGGALTFIETQVASASATIDFTSSIDSTYAAYKIIITGCRPATDATVLRCRTGNGGSFDSGAADYAWGFVNKLGTTTNSGIGDVSDAQIDMMNDMGNATTESVNLEVTLHSPANSALFTQIEWSLAGLTDNIGNGQQYTAGGGSRLEAAIVDRIQFLTSSGNIAEGRFTLYGIKHS